MKRLFLTFGLVIAFLISVNNVIAASGSIFDNASYQAPETKSIDYYHCGASIMLATDYQKCMAVFEQYVRNSSPTYDWVSVSCNHVGLPSTLVKCDYSWRVKDNKGNINIANYSTSYQRWQFQRSEKQSSCPPPDYPLYILPRDNNNDGKDDQCFNPDELDNLSNCANNVGSMLPAITNLSNKVCQTDPATGASCGFSKKDGDVVYKADLEVSCFGDGEKVPEYDPEPMPKPDTCAKVNDQLMVCKDDPKKKCDAIGRCADQCGFVNKEFYCFQQCTGEECDKTTPPPVNCETNPTAPVCVEEPEPDPEFCKANPTDAKCTTKPPEPCTGDDCGSTGGGGTGEKIDLKPVVDQLKDLNKKLDFKTTDKTGKTNFGGFSDLFSSSDIQAIKNMTDEKKQEITEQITTIKAEFKNMFEVTATGGAYTDITLNLSMGDFHPQFWSFIQANIGIIGAIVMALAYLMAIRIISE